MGSDGPLANAEVKVYKLQDYLDNNESTVGLTAVAEGVSDSEGKADDLEMSNDSGSGPFLVEVLAIPDSNDAETGAPISGTRDITTDAFPVIGVVRTIITQDQYNQTPQPRFYSTVFTTLAVDNAISNASDGSSETDVLSGLDAAASLVSSVLGFGLDDTVDSQGAPAQFDIFNTPPVIDENTLSVTQQTEAANYRAATETFAALVENLSTASGVSALNVLSAIAGDINDDGINNNSENGLADSSPIDIYAEISSVDDGYLIASGRLGALGSVADLVFDELAVSATPAGNTNDFDTLPSSPDSDNDGLTNENDSAPQNPDRDNDGALDGSDAFPDDASETADTDSDGVGDNADAFPNDATETTDTDSDGVGDNSDAFPNDATETTDTDSDGVGDNADAFPNDATETTDTDSDGVGDNSDAFPNDATETADTDSDGVGDNADAFPNDATETTDTDSDGVGDNADAFPNDATETTDTDSDGVGDNGDAFPSDAY